MPVLSTRNPPCRLDFLHRLAMFGVTVPVLVWSSAARASTLPSYRRRASCRGSPPPRRSPSSRPDFVDELFAANVIRAGLWASFCFSAPAMTSTFCSCRVRAQHDRAATIGRMLGVHARRSDSSTVRRTSRTSPSHEGDGVLEGVRRSALAPRQRISFLVYAFFLPCSSGLSPPTLLSVRAGPHPEACQPSLARGPGFSSQPAAWTHDLSPWRRSLGGGTPLASMVPHPHGCQRSLRSRRFRAVPLSRIPFQVHSQILGVGVGRGVRARSVARLRATSRARDPIERAVPRWSCRPTRPTRCSGPHLQLGDVFDLLAVTCDLVLVRLVGSLRRFAARSADRRRRVFVMKL